ncbi:MAG TPA: hypothetical protein VFQ80_09790 [Thermomicrobiales bacterium]|nr:hypothetical protein [Thermomicrobiales bacterium]
MTERKSTKLFDLGEQLSRRTAVQTYAPPALASIGALTIGIGYKHSGGDWDKGSNHGPNNGPSHGPNNGPSHGPGGWNHH